MKLGEKASWDEINDWMAEGNRQQKAFTNQHLKKYFARMDALDKAKRDIRIGKVMLLIEDILKL